MGIEEAKKRIIELGNTKYGPAEDTTRRAHYPQSSTQRFPRTEYDLNRPASQSSGAPRAQHSSATGSNRQEVPMYLVDAMIVVENGNDINPQLCLEEYDEVETVCAMSSGLYTNNKNSSEADGKPSYGESFNTSSRREERLVFYAQKWQKKPNVHVLVGNRHMKVLVDSGCSLGAVMCLDTANGIRMHHPELVLQSETWTTERSSKTVLYGVDGRMRSYIGGTLTLRHPVRQNDQQYINYTVCYSVLCFPRATSRFRTIWGVPMILAHSLGFALRDGTVFVTCKAPLGRNQSQNALPPQKKKLRTMPEDGKRNRIDGAIYRIGNAVDPEDEDSEDTVPLAAQDESETDTNDSSKARNSVDAEPPSTSTSAKNAPHATDADLDGRSL